VCCMVKELEDKITIIIPRSVKKEYRKLCLENDTTMSAPLIERVHEYINKHGKKTTKIG